MVLALDISQPLGIAAGIAYVPMVFCSYWFHSKYTAFSFAAVATILTILGYLTSTEADIPATTTIINRAISIVAIWITALTIYYRKRSEETLLHSQAALEMSMRETEEFAYIASHDLRAPLRAIDNLTQWIAEDLEEALTESTRENMRLLRGRVKRLDTLLDDILQFTKAGRTNEQKELVDVGDVLAKIGELTYLSDKFTLTVATPMPTISATHGTMELIFANLINNAIRHHDKDSGSIVVSCYASDNEWIFEVTDDGPGIAEEYRERVFEMFRKLEGRDKSEGSGMGLSIIRKFINLNGGRIWITDPPGTRGSRFQFSWPQQT